MAEGRKGLDGGPGVRAGAVGAVGWLRRERAMGVGSGTRPAALEASESANIVLARSRAGGRRLDGVALRSGPRQGHAVTDGGESDDRIISV